MPAASRNMIAARPIIMFAIDELRKIQPNSDYPPSDPGGTFPTAGDYLDVLCHSIIPILIKKVVTLDNLRVPLHHRRQVQDPVGPLPRDPVFKADPRRRSRRRHVREKPGIYADQNQLSAQRPERTAVRTTSSPRSRAFSINSSMMTRRWTAVENERSRNDRTRAGCHFSATALIGLWRRAAIFAFAVCWNIYRAKSPWPLMSWAYRPGGSPPLSWTA